MKQLIVAASALLFLAACANNNEKTEVKKDTAAAMAPMPMQAKFTADMVDNQRDPSCGMPARAGLEDTVHYKGHVIGFCSKECKDEFMKDPEKGLTAADLKKK
ncbi:MULTISPECIES: YHS domain-containing protein [unclassified Hydrotalea]|uniref:YHS domain-containing protein n=2 Tax=Hydrotalea TaxID=1004300 RepID=UPI001C54774B|nr:MULTISPECIES: YHS domain-containing protein [unclassified Hydrotalea]